MRLRKHFAVTLLLIGVSASAHAQALPPAVGAREVTLYARILAMTDTRQLDTALLDRALASKWRPMRAAAALAIGQVGTEPGMAGASRLRALLKDGDLTVAANAAYALGLLRDTASIADLGAALALNHEVAREAAWALGEMGAPARAAITTGAEARSRSRHRDPAAARGGEAASTADRGGQTISERGGIRPWCGPHRTRSRARARLLACESSSISRRRLLSARDRRTSSARPSVGAVHRLSERKSNAPLPRSREEPPNPRLATLWAQRH